MHVLKSLLGLYIGIAYLQWKIHYFEFNDNEEGNGNLKKFMIGLFLILDMKRTITLLIDMSNI